MKILRYVVLALLVAALAAGLLWIAAQNASILLRMPGREIEVSGVAAAIGLLIGAGVLYALIALVAWLWTLPGKIAKARREANQKKGLDAIASGWAALESGDPAEARKFANKASGLAPDQKLGRLLAARAALAAGDAPGAERLFGEIVDVPALAVAARKGLAEAALARGADTAAEAHAAAALTAAKSAVWPASFLLTRKVAAADWDGALAALDDAEKRGAVNQKVAQRKRAAILAAGASRASRAGDSAKALEMVQRAAKLAPGFAPASALAASLLAANGKGWAAADLIESAWEQGPHPALALAYRDLKAEEGVAAKAKWLEGLIQMNPGHRESAILRAEQALTVGDGLGAETILQPLLNEGWTSRLCGLMAAAAKAKGDPVAAREWIARSATAAREADWSDLDPEGTAFDYTDTDWARLVESYGTDGQLIHPRHERFAPERVAHRDAALAPGATVAADGGTVLSEDLDMPRPPDDPGFDPELADPDDAREADRPRFPFLR
jgi:HemY protein